jgi:hypothetical protein
VAQSGAVAAIEVLRKWVKETGLEVRIKEKQVGFQFVNFGVDN